METPAAARTQRLGELRQRLSSLISKRKDPKVLLKWVASVEAASPFTDKELEVLEEIDYLLWLDFRAEQYAPPPDVGRFLLVMLFLF